MGLPIASVAYTGLPLLSLLSLPNHLMTLICKSHSLGWKLLIPGCLCLKVFPVTPWYLTIDGYPRTSHLQFERLSFLSQRSHCSHNPKQSFLGIQRTLFLWFWKNASNSRRNSTYFCKATYCLIAKRSTSLHVSFSLLHFFLCTTQSYLTFVFKFTQ